jgi:hypothetical protein
MALFYVITYNITNDGFVPGNLLRKQMVTKSNLIMTYHRADAIKNLLENVGFQLAA